MVIIDLIVIDVLLWCDTLLNHYGYVLKLHLVFLTLSFNFQVL
jgi:hypothetical protein